MAPKRIILSSWAMRFYIRDGWELTILNSYVVRGRVAEKNFNNCHDPYFILGDNARLDVDRFLKDFPYIEIESMWREDNGKSKKELLESRNG